MKAEETLKLGSFTAEIIQDDDAQSPADSGDHGLFLVANHRQFCVAAPGEKRAPEDPEEIVERYKKTHWIFGLEAYIHSGVHLSLSGCGNYPDRRWDVSQLGFVFASKKEWRLSAKARLAAESLVGEWNKYLCGDVWGYRVEDADGKELVACWGFYGLECCKEEAMGILKCYVDKERKDRLAKLKSYIRSRVPLQHRFATA